jgi:hypothetical protein
MEHSFFKEFADLAAQNALHVSEATSFSACHVRLDITFWEPLAEVNAVTHTSTRTNLIIHVMSFAQLSITPSWTLDTHSVNHFAQLPIPNT